MAINFCRSYHLPSIICNKVSLDGYEVSNLISSVDACRKRGFRSESFISAPVEITVTFPYAIDVSHIVLGLQNGVQQTTACKVYTDTGLVWDGKPNNFHLVGSYENVTNPLLYLYNNRYKETRLFSEFPCVKPEGKRLYPKCDTYVCCVRSIKLCLTRTANSTSPALSRLELWGQPAKDCSSDLKQKIYKTECDIRSIYSSHILPDSETSSASGNSNDSGRTDAVDEITVPQEFLDSLTFEMMTQPVLLPSGNNVDQLTLEKYIETSSSWGRLPNDPFTGVPFSEESKPTFNADLKCRIDKFWLTYPSHCSGGRCIGPTNKTRLEFKFVRKKLAYSNTRTCNNSNRQVSDTVLHRRERRAIKLTAEKQKIPNRPKKKTTFAQAQNSEHAKELALSLKSSLRSVLQGCPSFINIGDTQEQSQSRKCVACQTYCEYQMYSLLCSHLLCRSCLLDQSKLEEVECKICHAQCKSSDVTRYHDYVSWHT